MLRPTNTAHQQQADLVVKCTAQPCRLHRDHRERGRVICVARRLLIYLWQQGSTDSLSLCLRSDQ